MPNLEIYVVDNPEQSRVLRTKSRKVQKVTRQLADLAYQMLETMHQADGVGLAAPQVGVLQRFFVAELPEDLDDPDDKSRGRAFILFNPEIVKSQGEQIGLEGCLSIPGWVGEVARYEQVTVQGLDERGKKVRHKVDGYLARVLQHEIDHLDGVLFTDNLTDPATFRQVEVGQEEAVELEAARA
ncbi:MAG: peptide deformylase [Anaerolineae bacterium]|nr:peptide deformylase [Anaerolineae bacterium]